MVTFSDRLTFIAGQKMSEERLFQKSVEKNDPDKKALSSEGLWCPELQRMFLRFALGARA